MKRFFWTACFVLFCTELQANSVSALSAAELAEACSEKDKSWIGFCDGYIQSAIDFIELHRMDVCIPAIENRNAVFDKIAPRLLQQSNSGENALISLVQMISDAYKCK